ncbi:MAG: uracil-DNA glycosylase [Rhizobiales bacterium]|nr:uracil-DNA glycosylase [Hyphomicrobiales bacterium]
MFLADDRPRTLRDATEIKRRRKLLAEPHMRGLREYVESLRSREIQVPDFDPMDAGIDAQALFLFEKPGPLAAASGFISRNNDDPTAEATFNFMVEAEIPRSKIAIWNVIPWWDGQIQLNVEQRNRGIEKRFVLVSLLPRLTAIMFVGRNAARVLPLFANVKYCYESAHPSARVRARYPKRWRSIPSKWAQVKSHFT